MAVYTSHKRTISLAGTSTVTWIIQRLETSPVATLSAGLCESAFFFVGIGMGKSLFWCLCLHFSRPSVFLFFIVNLFPSFMLLDFPLGLQKPIVIMSLKSPLWKRFSSWMNSLGRVCNTDDLRAWSLHWGVLMTGYCWESGMGDKHHAIQPISAFSRTVLSRQD